MATSPSPLIFQHLHGLTSIGYPDHCARFALARCGGNLHDALEFLLSGEITLYEEYRQVAAAHAAFQRLLERLEPERERSLRRASHCGFGQVAGVLHMRPRWCRGISPPPQ